MRDPARIDRIMRKLACVWEFQPDTRFFQLIDNTFCLPGVDPYHIEDDKVEAKLDEILRNL